MISRRRVLKVYTKELKDILRDRRALAAMIVVPLVLYPLLMLGSVQAISATVPGAKPQSVLIGVETGLQALAENIVESDRRWLENQRARETADAPSDADSAPPPTGSEPGTQNINASFTKVAADKMEAAVRGRLIHAGLIFQQMEMQNPNLDQWTVEIIYDPEEVKSQSAARWLQGVLERSSVREVERRMTEVYLVPLRALEPIVVNERRVSSPGSILSLIVPLILVLMTITGAIYPAIDLTAGERERGTLETLMVCPVPTFELIVGKFLVVTTVAVAGAALNLGSVSATVYFGGLEQVLHGQSDGGGFPFSAVPVILLSLVPFAILFSAVMMAVCSFARTFKEAQNYITPVILSTLIPGGIAALPTSELDGVFTVIPVANMVLLTRELLLGSAVPLATLAWVLASTTLYAGAAVAVAARVYGVESVVFADSGSMRASLSRRVLRPSAVPSAAVGILLMALLFPVWYFMQIHIQTTYSESLAGAVRASAAAMPLFFVVVPLAVMAYRKINVVHTLRLMLPSIPHLVGGIVLGLALWVPAAEISALQTHWFGAPAELAAKNEALLGSVRALPWWQVIVYIGVVPGICEELAFRGFLLSSLGACMRKWTAIIITAGVFAVFHFFFFKIPVTAALGIVLGYVCWQSRSILPGVIAHTMHNSILMLLAVDPDVATRIGLNTTDPAAHLPVSILVPGLAAVGIGLALLTVPRRGDRTPPRAGDAGDGATATS